MTPPMNDLVIDLESVVRTFGAVTALDGLSLQVPAGSVTVLLGPNGAGKTTTVRVITGALVANSGKIRVLGLDPHTDGGEIRTRTGVVPPKPAMYDNLTGADNLRFAADLWGVGHEGIEAAAARFDISFALDLDVGGYSTGMRTRLALARAVIHDPDVLLLDEPTAGLDPESSRAVLDLIRELAERGRTILMCTHLLHEAEGIADQVVLMGEGKARASGHPSELAAAFLEHPTVVFDAENRQELERATTHKSVIRHEWNGGLQLTLESMETLPDLVAELVSSGVRLIRVEPQLPTLEHLYFEMQRVMREETT
jgi:ABC-type multidrug transport system ATPase subunit